MLIMLATAMTVVLLVNADIVMRTKRFMKNYEKLQELSPTLEKRVSR